MKFLLTMLVSTLFVFGSFQVAKKPSVISPDQAFKVSLTENNNTVKINFNLAPKIYLYKDSLTFAIVSPKKVVLSPKLPDAHIIEGDSVYEGNFSVTIDKSALSDTLQGKADLEVAFEGCSDTGICYQPQKRHFTLHITPENPTFIDKITSALSEGNAGKIADLLAQETALFTLLLFFVFGVLLSLTPCIFPMIPILSSIIISGQSKEKKPSALKGFIISLVYVLAMAMTYAVVGVIAGKAGADIQAAMQNPWVLSAFAAIFVALAFSLFGYYEITLPSRLQQKLTKASDNAGKKGGLIGAAIMGVLSALIVGPCVAPPLAGAVLFISHTGDAVLGGLALFVMSLGMGLPLLLVGMGASKIMPKPGSWMMRVSHIFGVIMLALAVMMLSRFLPASVTMMLWALLFIGTALSMEVFDSLQKRGTALLFKLLAMTLLLYGIALFIGALAGATSMLNPFEPFKGGGIAQAEQVADTKKYRGYTYERLMQEVRASNKPVVVDFTKESCAACKELELFTFPDPKVKEELKHFTFIKVDVTDNTDAEQEMMRKLGIFGTPNLVFFKDGKQLRDLTLTGFIDAQTFSTHLRTIRHKGSK